MILTDALLQNIFRWKQCLSAMNLLPERRRLATISNCDGRFDFRTM